MKKFEVSPFFFLVKGTRELSMDWWAFASNIVNRIPFERILIPPRDNAKSLQGFVTSLERTENRNEVPSEQKTVTSTVQKPQRVGQSGSTGVITRQDLDPETMRWQLEEARGELWELEGHLKHYCKGCGADFSCCFKHSQNIIDIARETKSMTTDPIWDAITKLGEEIRQKAHPDHIRAETYFAEFPQLTVRVSELRRPIETQLIQLSSPEISLEEAKKLAAEEAAKEVERQWQSQEKK